MKRKASGSSPLGTMISLFHRDSVPSWYLAKSRTWLEEPITWITLRCRRHCISLSRPLSHTMASLLAESSFPPFLSSVHHYWSPTSLSPQTSHSFSFRFPLPLDSSLLPREKKDRYDSTTYVTVPYVHSYRHERPKEIPPALSFVRSPIRMMMLDVDDEPTATRRRILRFALLSNVNRFPGFRNANATDKRAK